MQSPFMNDILLPSFWIWTPQIGTIFGHDHLMRPHGLELFEVWMKRIETTCLKKVTAFALFLVMSVFTTCLLHPTGQTCSCDGGCGNSGITSAHGNEGESQIGIFWFRAGVADQIECGYHNGDRWPWDMFLVFCLPENGMCVLLVLMISQKAVARFLKRSQHRSVFFKDITEI